MKETDYKFWYILRKDDVHVDECAIRIYEGQTVKKTQVDKITNESKVVDVYKREKRLQVADVSYLGSVAIKKEESGNDTFVYTSKDFGVISTDDELRAFLDKELGKDTTRTPIKEQRVLKQIKK